MTEERPSLSLVLPVRGQADHIARVVDRLADAALGLADRVEVILVVNGPPDGSLEACGLVAARRPEVRVVERREPGWGGAVRAGLAVATGDLLCFTNSARTTPEDLAAAVRAAMDDPEVAVKAVRPPRGAAVRRIGSLVYAFEARVLFGVASTDLNGTPKVFRRSWPELAVLGEDGDLLDLEWCVRCRRAGRRVVEVRTASAERHGGRTSTGWRSAIGMYGGAIRLRRRLTAEARR